MEFVQEKFDSFNVLTACNRTDAFFNVTNYHNKTCVNSIFAEEEEFVLGVAVAACGFLSMLGALFIIFTFTFFRRLNVPALRLVLYLSITDFLSTFDYITSSADSYSHETCELYPICYFQSIMGQFSELARIFWVSCIAFNLYTIAVRGMSERIAMRLEKVYHIVSWGVPTLSVIIVLAFNMVGPAGAWCWVSEEFLGARLALLYLWLIFGIIFVLFCYIQVGFAVRGSPLVAVMGRLRWYVLIFLGCNVFGLINRIQNFADPCHPVYGLYLLQSITNALQGICNAVVYGANNIVIDQFKICAKNGPRSVLSCFDGDDDDVSVNGSSPRIKQRLRKTSSDGFGGLFEKNKKAEDADYQAMGDGDLPDYGYSSSDDES